MTTTPPADDLDAAQHTALEALIAAHTTAVAVQAHAAQCVIDRDRAVAAAIATGLTGTQIAEILGVKQQQVSQWHVKGKRAAQ